MSRFFDSRRDSIRQIQAWATYTTFFPFDPRGYANRIDYLKRLAKPDRGSILAAYEQWLEKDRFNLSLRREYASYCLDIGNEEFEKNRLGQAAAAYRKVMQLDSTSAVAFNNLGSALAEMGITDSALVCFRRAIDIDSNYSDAYFNLGQAYINLRDTVTGVKLIRRAARLGNFPAREYLRLK